MSSIAVKGFVSLMQVGTIYNATVNSHSILADNEEELFAEIGAVHSAEYTSPFQGNGFTWTFIKDDSAEHYDVAVKHPEHRSLAQSTATMAFRSTSGMMPSTYMIYPSIESYEAADWIAANAKGKVLAWTLPCSSEHFYLFEDNREALLFKLQVQKL